MCSDAQELTQSRCESYTRTHLPPEKNDHPFHLPHLLVGPSAESELCPVTVVSGFSPVMGAVELVEWTMSLHPTPPCTLTLYCPHTNPTHRILTRKRFSVHLALLTKILTDSQVKIKTDALQWPKGQCSICHLFSPTSYISSPYPSISLFLHFFLKVPYSFLRAVVLCSTHTL